MPSSSPSSAGTNGSVLLVEEYAALAAAIGAALKKFAPGHAIQRVRSLGAALETAMVRPPDLLILDFDPPHLGILDFFNELCQIAPDAQVIVIAAGLPVEVLRDERLPTVFRFVEKPFQLEDLGAAIATLTTSAHSASETSSTRRSLESLTLADMIPLLGIEGLTGTVGVTAADGALVGEISFARGCIPNACASDLQGIDAVREMLRWPSPEFSLTKGANGLPCAIEGKWPKVLEKVVRSIPRPLPVTASRKAGKRRSAGKTSAPELAPAPIVKDGKKVLVIDDTETLRIFVEEMLSTTDPRLQIVSAADGGEGVSRCASFRPDLLLLDYSLPDFNGDEVCRRLLADETTRDIPIIMMSGHVAEMAEAAARYENIVLTLAKPFVSGELIQAVTATLSKPPERRRPKIAPPPVKSDPPLAKTEHKSNGHAPRPAPAPMPPAQIASAPTASTAPISVVPPATSLESAQIPAPTPPPPARIAAAPTASISPVSVLPPASSFESAHIPAHVAVANSDAVLISIDLEVVSMQFSPTLQITNLRARPTSPAILLHVDPRAISAVPLPEVAFEIAHAQLNDTGELHALRIVPAIDPPSALPPHTGVSVERLAILPANGHGGLQITPAAAARMTVQLMAAFDLAGVKLSPTFSVAHFALRSRGGRMRVILPGHRDKHSTLFQATQVALDHKGRIAEIELSAL